MIGPTREIRSSLAVYTAPTTEPLTTAEAKLHLRVDHVDEDDYIAALVTSARMHVEQVTGRALLNTTLDFKLDGWPEAEYLEVPRSPLSSVTSITYTDTSGTTATVSASDYTVDTAHEPGRIVLKSTASWPNVALLPGPAIVVRFVAGYGAAASSVPGPIKTAVRLLVGHWYAHREAVIDLGRRELIPVPMAVDSLLAPYRIYNF